MNVVAITHGYPPGYSMGGEVSLHRTLTAAKQPVTVLTRTEHHYTLDGIQVAPIGIDDVLNIEADPAPLVWQLAKLDADVVIAQNELSLPAVRAARALGIPSIVSVHTPPRYGHGIKQAVREADYRIFNTETSAREWGYPRDLVIHPPISPLPPKPTSLPTGDAYTLLSNLVNKGVSVVLDLAARMPDQRFLIVRSPAETTHGLQSFDDIAATLPNVTVAPRVSPEQVADQYLAQTRILLVPSKMETYAMSPIEAAGYGIPSVCIMNDHVAEGIGHAAYGTGPLNADQTAAGIHAIESDYTAWSQRARAQAEATADRQVEELAAWAEWLPTCTS